MAEHKSGRDYLEFPLLNKGTAFTLEERRRCGLLGLLPPYVETLEQQAARAWEAYRQKHSDLERHIYLRNLQDTNETLFYRLVDDHLEDMMPVIYTPVVGLACQKFSEIYRRARGLFIPYPEREHIDEMLANAMVDDVRIIVVTDGERILGLGDQGAGGMGIPIGKLSLYTACGGIDPSCTLPVLLDVGTNNEAALNDPMYIGWRNKRISGAKYEDFIDMFVRAVHKRWPNVLLQFEDFAKANASPLLERYRDRLCCFNDDIQGTAAVAAGTLLAALQRTGERLVDQRVLFVGSGSAGCGIAEQIVQLMMRDGLTDAEARSHIYMTGRRGLLHTGMDGLLDFQARLSQPIERISDWVDTADGNVSLDVAMQHAQPTILVGVSGQPGLFTEDMIRAMAGWCERPVIFPLSNPTSRAEATPADIYAWTEGRALVATGSPFAPVEYAGRSHRIAQSNNSYIFPGLGLGVLACNARRITDGMFMAAADTLGEYPCEVQDADCLLPPLSRIREVSRAVAVAVAMRAVEEGQTDVDLDATQILERIDAIFWHPRYRSYI